MLKAFFEIGADPAWFEELKISKEKDYAINIWENIRLSL